MQEYVTELSKYLINLCMCIYTLECFLVFVEKWKNSRVIYITQNLLIFLVQLLCFADLVLVSDQFLPSLDELFARLEEEDFLTLLPELRLAFRYFTPMEISRIAARAAALHGVAPERLRRPASLDYAYGEALDAWAAKRLGAGA